jgi:hypothetical protein
VGKEVGEPVMEDSTRILVSFCNVADASRPILGTLDPGSMEYRPVALPADLPRCQGVTGLASSGPLVFAATSCPVDADSVETPGRSAMLVLRRDDLGLVNRYIFRTARDVHSLCAFENNLFVVSTGTDELIRLRLDGPEVVSEEVVWRPDPLGQRTDVNHLNGLCLREDEVIISGFGPRAGALWGSAGDGFVRVVGGDPLVGGIAHPHSPMIFGGTLAYCDSRPMTVRIAGADRSCLLPGYARGLCLLNDTFFAGSSVGRRVSKSSGQVIENPADPGEVAGSCAISRISAENLAIEQTINLDHLAREIYDLMVL